MRYENFVIKVLYGSVILLWKNFGVIKAGSFNKELPWILNVTDFISQVPKAKLPQEEDSARLFVQSIADFKAL